MGASSAYGRELWLRGERVDDVTRHSDLTAFAAVVHCGLYAEEPHIERVRKLLARSS